MRRRKRSLGSTRHAAIFSPPLGRAQPIGMKKGTPVPPRPAPLRQSVLTFRSCVAQEFADRISKRWPSTLSPIKKLQSGGMKKKMHFPTITYLHWHQHITLYCQGGFDWFFLRVWDWCLIDRRLLFHVQ